MIITKIQHGLGNQMFQYAIGRKMAEKNRTDLKLDISQYENQNKNDTRRDYSLDCFDVKESFVKKSDIKTFSAHNFSESNILKRLIRKFFIKIQNNKPVEKRNYITESKIISKKDILKNKNKNIYLYGGWQDEIYFKDIRNIGSLTNLVGNPME